MSIMTMDMQYKMKGQYLEGKGQYDKWNRGQMKFIAMTGRTGGEKEWKEERKVREKEKNDKWINEKIWHLTMTIFTDIMMNECKESNKNIKWLMTLMNEKNRHSIKK